MSVRFTHVAWPSVAAGALLAGIACGQPARPAAPVSEQATAAPKAEITTKAPEDWVIYDDATYTPVVDEVSQHLAAARKAFDAGDRTKAATELRAVADALKRQSSRADAADKALVSEETTLLAANAKAAREAVDAVNASAVKVGQAAAGVEQGTIKTTAQLDKIIDRATRADMDRRWVVSDVETWYPVIEEPQRHFTNAVADVARKDYKAAATNVRKAASYLRLESGRAVGDAKAELDASVAELDALAARLDAGTAEDAEVMAQTFGKADHALAIAHRAKAAESWAYKEYDQAGHELKAAAFDLDSAARWAGDQTHAAETLTVSDARELGDRLVAGAAWTRDELANAFESLGKGLDDVGQKIGVTTKAAPVDVLGKD